MKLRTLLVPGGLAAGTAALVAASTWRGVRAANQAVPRHQAFWEEPVRSEGDLVLVVLGDSAAQSIGTTDPLRGYVGRLAGRLQSRTGFPVAVVNLSISGARAADVVAHQLPRLAELRRRPDVVLCVIGGNDAYFGTSPAQFEEDFTALVDALPAEAIIGDIPCFRLPHWERRVVALNRIVHEQAALRGLEVAPIHAATRRMTWAAHLKSLSADRFHPNEKGYRVWAAALWTVLDRRFPCPPARSAGGQRI